MALLFKTKYEFCAFLDEILPPNCNVGLQFTVKYINPTVHVIAICVHFLNAFLFFSTKSKLYKCLTANSIVDSIFFALSIFANQSLCSNKQSIIFDYWHRFNELYFRIYLLRVFNMLSSLINLKIAYDRYKAFKSSKKMSLFINKKDWSVTRDIVIMIFASVVFYTPNIIFNKINKIEISSLLKLNETSNNTCIENMLKCSPHTPNIFFLSFKIQKEIEITISSLQICAIILCLAFMITLNILIYKHHKAANKIEFRFEIRRLNGNTVKLSVEKRESTALKHAMDMMKANNKITKMVIWISCVFCGQQILIASSIIANIFQKNSEFYLAFIFLIYTLLSLSYTFFYYLYYKKYREIINNFINS